MDETRGETEAAAEAPEPASRPPEPATRAPEPALPERPPFDRRAANVLILLGLVAVLGGLLVFAVAATAPTPVRVIVLVLALASGIAAGAASIGLDRRRPWAPATAVPMLWIVVVGGVVRFLAGLGAASLWIPLDAPLALWALTGAGRPAGLFPAGRRVIGTVLLAALVGGQLAGPVATVLSTPGLSPWVVDRSALDGGLRVSCVAEGSGHAAGLSVRVSWAWARRDTFPDGLDVLGVAFAAPGSDASSMRFDVTGMQASDPVITLGGGGASDDLVQRELAGMSASVTWLLDAGRDGLRDGGVALRIVESTASGSSPTVVPSDVQVRAVYAHDGRWTVSADTACGG